MASLNAAEMHPERLLFTHHGWRVGYFHFSFQIGARPTLPS